MIKEHEARAALLAYRNYNNVTGGDASSNSEQKVLEWVLGANVAQFRTMIDTMRAMTDEGWSTAVVAAARTTTE